MKLYRKVNILGTKYSIYRVCVGEDEFMDKMHYGGYCSDADKKIVLLDLESTSDWKNEPKEIREKTEKCTLRHELVHAFLNESGLMWNSFAPDKAWAKNEEMVDWIAIQSPKLFKVFQEVNAL